MCDTCESWVHCPCVPMTDEAHKDWDDEKLLFMCPRCIRRPKDGSVNFVALLTLLNLGQYRDSVRSTRLLLDTYKIALPDRIREDVVRGREDNIAVRILKLFHPVILKDFSPRAVRGDGNCMYRAVSLGLFGTEDHHQHIRLLTALEICENSEYYERDFINDHRIVTGTYQELRDSCAKLGSYAEMTHMYAVSAALKTPIRSYLPPSACNQLLSEPFSRTVHGRGVRSSATPTIVLMWSQMSVPARGILSPNHFVLLCPTAQSPTVDLDESPGITISFTEDETSRASDCNETKDEDESSSIQDDVTTQDDEPADMPHATGHPIRKPLDIEEIINIIGQPDEIHEKIPPGIKNNVYFVINNTRNMDRRKEGKKSEFWDDCGVWNTASGASPKTTYIIAGKHLKKLFVRNGIYCNERMVNKKRTYVPLEPQPSEDVLVHTQRYYSTLKSDKDYKKRVTWINTSPTFRTDIAVIEYTGTFPGHTVHGLSRKSDTDYIRTPGTTLQRIATETKTKKPRRAYNDMVTDMDILDAPRNLQQVRNKKHYETKKAASSQGNTKNLADQLQTLSTWALTDDRIRSVETGRNFCVAIYSANQLDDIKRFCCTGKTPLGFDKTFNLGEVFVTASVYKQLSVTNCTNDDHPIMLGPLFLHGTSTFEAYHPFFSKLSASLRDTDTSRLILGSDDEKALRDAIKFNFPTAKKILCTRHLKTNIDDYLKNKTGVNESDRRKLITSIFGEDGLTSADDVIFDIRAKAIEEEIIKSTPTFLKYFRDRIIPATREIMETTRDSEVAATWTNNDCESINHVMKQLTDWKPKPAHELAAILMKHIESQYKDVERAMIGMGNYRLAAAYKQFTVNPTIYASKQTAERERIFQRFMRSSGTNLTQITSTDGKLTILRAPSAGKKLNQGKRKRTNRTTTIKKTKTTKD